MNNKKFIKKEKQYNIYLLKYFIKLKLLITKL